MANISCASTMGDQALGGQIKLFYIYLPPSYNTPQGRNKHYPTLYLLHSSPGTYKDWVTAGNANRSAGTLITSKKIPELIMVFPDGNGQIFLSEWGNSFNQQQLMETYVAVDLVRYVDQNFRTIPQAADQGIGGLPMGGLGAMNIATPPDIFGTDISLGGYYRADGGVWGAMPTISSRTAPSKFSPTIRRPGSSISSSAREHRMSRTILKRKSSLTCSIRSRSPTSLIWSKAITREMYVLSTGNAKP